MNNTTRPIALDVIIEVTTASQGGAEVSWSPAQTFTLTQLHAIFGILKAQKTIASMGFELGGSPEEGQFQLRFFSPAEEFNLGELISDVETIIAQAVKDQGEVIVIRILPRQGEASIFITKPLTLTQRLNIWDFLGLWGTNEQIFMLAGKKTHGSWTLNVFHDDQDEAEIFEMIETAIEKYGNA